jgi:hypothetical protein
MSRSQSTFSPEPRFAQQLDVLQQQNPNKYLQTAKDVTKNSSTQTRKGGIEGKLTSQHLAGRLDNTKKEGFTLLAMNNPRHQIGSLFFQGGYFLHIATG